ncbi:MAG: L-2-amino-thiazoline-4-carboxylic acid hydrolase [Chloroflexia bacterium]|nr:L-2-amino-thiazoline-4-carboxylic acid hydrolase [Chloroflexia bacterium]
MANLQKNGSFPLGLLLGALGGGFLARRLGQERRLPNLQRWQRLLAETRGPFDAAMLMARVHSLHADLYERRPRFAHPALCEHLENNILPGLALYQVLREELGDQEAALAEVERLFVAAYAGFQRVLQLLGYFPDPFGLFARILPWVMQRSFPPEGWEVRWIGGDSDCIGMDIHRCFYLELLTQYGAPELTALYCQMDDVGFASLPAGIAWKRTGTLGRGDDCCDFRWCRE